jgi:hypothetical protein
LPFKGKGRLGGPPGVKQAGGPGSSESASSATGG